MELEDPDQKQMSFLRTIYSKTEKKRVTRSKEEKAKSFAKRWAFVRYIPHPGRFDQELLEAQITRTSDLVPYWSDWVFDSNIPTPNISDERVPDSLGPGKEEEWVRNFKEKWRQHAKWEEEEEGTLPLLED